MAKRMNPLEKLVYNIINLDSNCSECGYRHRYDDKCGLFNKYFGTLVSKSALFFIGWDNEECKKLTKSLRINKRRLP